MLTLTLFKMAANTNIENAIDLALFMEEVQKYDCLYNKFSKEYRDKYEKINCWKVIGEKFDLSPEYEFSVFPVASSSTSKKTHNYKKTRLSRSRRFTAAMLNLRNGANHMLLDPGTLGLHSAIAAIIWKPSIAAIAEPFLSAIVAIIWKPGFSW